MPVKSPQTPEQLRTHSDRLRHGESCEFATTPPTPTNAIRSAPQSPRNSADGKGFFHYFNSTRSTLRHYERSTLIHLLKAYGLRVSELLGLRWADVLSNDQVLIRPKKRGRARVITIDGSTAVKTSLSMEAQAGALFPYTYKQIKAYCLSLGIVSQPEGYGKRIVTHLPRHELAEAVNAIAGSAAAGDVLGHRSKTSIAHYIPPEPPAPPPGAKVRFSSYVYYTPWGSPVTVEMSDNAYDWPGKYYFFQFGKTFDFMLDIKIPRINCGAIFTLNPSLFYPDFYPTFDCFCALTVQAPPNPTGDHCNIMCFF